MLPEMLRLPTELRWDDALTELEGGQTLGEPTILFKKLDAESLFDGEG